MKMETPFRILLSLCLLYIVIHSRVNGATIQLYKHQNFTGLLWESNSTANCTNIPKSENDNVYSIRTDTCFIAFHDPDCKSRWSMKYMPGNIDLSEYDLGRDGRIRSFHNCNEEEGGNQLIVDITKYYTFSYLSSFVPDILQSYRNVCSCVNIPQCVQNMDIWSINNHHNALLAYYEPNCTENKWPSIQIAAGHSMDTRYMHDHIQTDSETQTTYKIQSFGPNTNSSYYSISCVSAHMTIENVELSSTESTTTSLGEDNINFNERIEFLTSRINELQTQYDQLNETLVVLQNAVEIILKKQINE